MKRYSKFIIQYYIHDVSCYIFMRFKLSIITHISTLLSTVILEVYHLQRWNLPTHSPVNACMILGNYDPHPKLTDTKFGSRASKLHRNIMAFLWAYPCFAILPTSCFASGRCWESCDIQVMCVLLFKIKIIVHGSLSSSFKIETNLALRPSIKHFRRRLGIELNVHSGTMMKSYRSRYRSRCNKHFDETPQAIDSYEVLFGSWLTNFSHVAFSPGFFFPRASQLPIPVPKVYLDRLVPKTTTFATQEATPKVSNLKAMSVFYWTIAGYIVVGGGGVGGMGGQKRRNACGKL